MDDVKWERYGAAAGVLFVILIVVGTFIPGSPPSPDDSIQKLGKYYVDHTGAIKVSAFLIGLAAVAFLWFLGSLWSMLRRAEDTRRLATIAVGGGIVALVLVLTAFALNSTLAIAVNSSGATAGVNPKFIYLLSLTIGGMANFGVAVLVGATAVATLRTRVFPALLGWASVMLAVGWLVAGYAVATDNQAIFIVGFIVFIAWVVWILAISFFLFRPREQAALTSQ